VKKQWDKHCPECGSDERELILVKPTALKRRCSECGHEWWEERDGMTHGKGGTNGPGQVG
jgi:hypothetical protein